MMEFNIEGEDIFFDTEDSFLPEESFSVREDSNCANLSSGIWSNELKSVKERREDFLNRMGFLEDIYSSSVKFDRYVTSETDKVMECSEDYEESCCVPDILVEDSCISEEFRGDESEDHIERCSKNIDLDRKVKNWWKNFVYKMKSPNKDEKFYYHKEEMKVEKKKKKCKELSVLYTIQEICAHKGIIWTMKFSPNGQYLATGGEAGILRVWGVMSKKFLRITEKPVREFIGHTSDILDLAWSSSNKLISASKDNTVSLWHMDSDKCQSIFRHCDYVTCIQFNPMNENYFTSGSVDGKLRIWSVPQKRVVNWADVHDIITAICYCPNGKGIVTGSYTGICRFYDVSGSELLLDAERRVLGKKKSGNKITGIQFLENSSQRVMVTSEDSKICILDGFDIIYKYKGPTKSGSHSSASLTPNGKHILSVGEDSRIYIWNVNDPDPPIRSSKRKKSTRPCERFLCEGVSVALPWQNKRDVDTDCELTYDSHDSCFSVRNTDQNSLSSCFSMTCSTKSSATWPEEKLDVLQRPYNEEADQISNYHNHIGTWGLIIVTAGWDGLIRTFHNYGLPTRT